MPRCVYGPEVMTGRITERPLLCRSGARLIRRCGARPHCSRRKQTQSGRRRCVPFWTAVAPTHHNPPILFLLRWILEGDADRKRHPVRNHRRDLVPVRRVPAKQGGHRGSGDPTIVCRAIGRHESPPDVHWHRDVRAIVRAKALDQKRIGADVRSAVFHVFGFVEPLRTWGLKWSGHRGLRRGEGVWETGCTPSSPSPPFAVRWRTLWSCFCVPSGPSVRYFVPTLFAGVFWPTAGNGPPTASGQWPTSVDCRCSQ